MANNKASVPNLINVLSSVLILIIADQTLDDSLVLIKFVSLFSTTQKVNDPCGQHIYIQEQCSTFDIDKDK